MRYLLSKIIPVPMRSTYVSYSFSTTVPVPRRGERPLLIARRHAVERCKAEPTQALTESRWVQWRGRVFRHRKLGISIV